MDNMLRTLGNTYIKLNPVEGFAFSKLKLVKQETIDAFKDGTLEAEKDTLYYSNTFELPYTLTVEGIVFDGTENVEVNVFPEDPLNKNNKFLGFNESTGDKEWKEVDMDSKLDKNLGSENKGKLLTVDDGGDIFADDTVLVEIEDLNKKVTSITALGGYLNAHDFGMETPDQEALTNYALSQIDNISDRVDIWNGTKVKNLNSGETWVLINTPMTNPVIFEWSNLGIDFINTATNDTLGIVKGSTDSLKIQYDSHGVGSVNGLSNSGDGTKYLSDNGLYETIITDLSLNIEDGW